ncbi:MAG TPA: NADH-ubiquinone oxidoreductase-F iron-sulfur binding region domain-containing protein [Acidimicrobiia bacterium]|nr:NADH-ubiquinone oxidoreductase-F iron-sulfur binding region domain-containing protein [Acidimicrobiia bacterium]
MDLRFMADEPSAAERAVIAGLIDPVESRHGQVVRGGHAARGHRHLLLPALAAVQSELGWVSRGALNEISRRLLVPPAEAYGVASFYALISTDPRPAEVTHVCDDIACRQAGGLDLLSKLSERDDVVTTPCLGQCDRRPAMFVQRAGGQDEVLVGGSPATVHAGPLLRRVGKVDPSSLTDYRQDGGFEALARAQEIGAEAVIAEVKKSALKGRGGAAFPTGVKWEAVANEPAPRYLVCNADESEPGTFKDRVVMESDPFAVVEAIAIAAFATGCEKAYIYIRGEYPLATARITAAIAASRQSGMLDELEINIFRGQGAYICGEETALFNSIEGFRGEPRQKPPFPAQAGLFGRPTVINNVETLINVPEIVLEGGDAYASVGTADSTGTRLFCLSGDLARPGTYEIEMGRTLGDLVELAGGFAGEPKAILLGGAAGFFVSSEYLSMPLTFEDARARGVTLGSGVVMAFNHDRDMKDVVRRVARFFRDESCGQCVPCRVGTVRIEEAVARARSAPIDRPLIADLDRAMKDASICGLGHTAASVVQSAMAMDLI